MLRFHNPRISNSALDLMPGLLREKSGASDRVKGQILGLPVYHAMPDSKLTGLARSARRVGWRYLFQAADESSGSDAIIEFGRTEARKPFLKSYARSTQPQTLTGILAEFERERAEDDIAFYLQILSVPALKFELLWFKDARRNEAQDDFRPLSPARFGGTCEDELAGRFATLTCDSGNSVEAKRI